MSPRAVVLRLSVLHHGVEYGETLYDSLCSRFTSPRTSIQCRVRGDALCLLVQSFYVSPYLITV